MLHFGCCCSAAGLMRPMQRKRKEFDNGGSEAKNFEAAWAKATQPQFHYAHAIGILSPVRDEGADARSLSELRLLPGSDAR